MPEYIDAQGHLIISILKNKDGKCIRATFQPDRFKEMIKAFGGEASVEQVEFIIEGDGMLMATLANQLMGGQAAMRQGSYMPSPQGLPFRGPSLSMQPQGQISPVGSIDDDDTDDDDDDTDDDLDDDDDTT